MKGVNLDDTAGKPLRYACDGTISGTFRSDPGLLGKFGGMTLQGTSTWKLIIYTGPALPITPTPTATLPTGGVPTLTATETPAAKPTEPTKDTPTPEKPTDTPTEAPPTPLSTAEPTQAKETPADTPAPTVEATGTPVPEDISTRQPDSVRGSLDYPASGQSSVAHDPSTVGSTGVTFAKLFAPSAESKSDAGRLVGWGLQVRFMTAPTNTPTATLTGTPTPTNTATPARAVRPANAPAARPAPACPSGEYRYNSSTGGEVVPASDDVGMRCENCARQIPLPFAFKLYDRTFRTVIVDSRGALGFGNGGDPPETCLPSRHYDYAIFPLWGGISTNCEGCGIFTSVSGIATDRIYSIEWRAVLEKTARSSAPTVNFEVRLYETVSDFEIVYGRIPNSLRPAIGLQGRSANSFTEYLSACASNPLMPGMRLIFQPVVCAGDATPVPVPPGHVRQPGARPGQALANVPVAFESVFTGPVVLGVTLAAIGAIMLIITALFHALERRNVRAFQRFRTQRARTKQ
jgi:hypothetical protein